MNLEESNLTTAELAAETDEELEETDDVSVEDKDTEK